MGYPSTWNESSYSDIPPYEGSDNYGKEVPLCFEQGISLPETADEPPLDNYKPPAQARSTAMWADGLGILHSHQMRLNYVNFYAYVTKLSDGHFGTLLDALESNRGLWKKTLVFALADHGRWGRARRHAREGVQRVRGDDPRPPGRLEPGALPGPREDPRPGLADRPDAHGRLTSRRAEPRAVRVHGVRPHPRHPGRRREPGEPHQDGSGLHLLHDGRGSGRGDRGAAQPHRLPERGRLEGGRVLRPLGREAVPVRAVRPRERPASSCTTWGTRKTSSTSTPPSLPRWWRLHRKMGEVEFHPLSVKAREEARRRRDGASRTPER